jgi:hypothetical protein
MYQSFPRQMRRDPKFNADITKFRRTDAAAVSALC